MPICHRCKRMQASAELRRTTLGHVCKDSGDAGRCATLTRQRREQEQENRRNATHEHNEPEARTT